MRVLHTVELSPIKPRIVRRALRASLHNSRPSRDGVLVRACVWSAAPIECGFPNAFRLSIVLNGLGVLHELDNFGDSHDENVLLF